MNHKYLIFFSFKKNDLYLIESKELKMFFINITDITTRSAFYFSINEFSFEKRIDIISIIFKYLNK